MTDTKIEFKSQNVYLENREKLSITGVEQVENFNDNTITLSTIKGEMTIKGQELNISSLNLENGNVKIDGCISGILYSDKKSSSKGNILSKMFK